MSDSTKDVPDIVQDKNSKSRAVSDKFSVFFSNDYHTFVVQKTERLASAVYVVTGFMPNDEPVRLKLRNCVLDLVTHTCNPIHFIEIGTDQFTSRCAEIGTILETAQSAGLISPMNARIICDEYASLAHFVKNNRVNISHRQNITKNGSHGGISVKSPLENDRFSDFGLNVSSKRQIGMPKKRQVDRRTSILNLFKNKDKISIKDASSSIVGCSEKTIQRELLSLVQEGILIKEGDRRWTTYRTAH